MPSLDHHARALAALRFRALGDETRLRVLELLIDGEQCVADLMDETSLGQSLVSHHLRTLRQAGLVVDRRDGRFVYYAISDTALADTIRALTNLELADEPSASGTP